VCTSPSRDRKLRVSRARASQRRDEEESRFSFGERKLARSRRAEIINEHSGLLGSTISNRRNRGKTFRERSRAQAEARRWTFAERNFRRERGREGDMNFRHESDGGGGRPRFKFNSQSLPRACLSARGPILRGVRAAVGRPPIVFSRM